MLKNIFQNIVLSHQIFTDCKIIRRNQRSERLRNQRLNYRSDTSKNLI